MIKFLKTTFIDNYIGCLIGLAIALILLLILCLTVFRESKAGKIISCIFIIPFVFLGSYIQQGFFSKTKVDPVQSIPNYNVIIEKVSQNLADNWKNTNGGFTFDEIKKSQNDGDCPIADDQIIKLECIDFGDYIDFAYQESETYYNILFIKTNNGLVFDGKIDITILFPNRDHFFMGFNYNFGNTIITSQLRFPVYENIKAKNILINDTNNLFSLSSRTCKNINMLQRMWCWNYYQTIDYAFAKQQDEVQDNLSSRFQSFGDVELTYLFEDDKHEKALNVYNSFYNYLYQSIKDNDYNTTKSIDCNSIMCLPIPSELKSNYPIPEDKKVDYNNKDFYCVYKTDIACKLHYTQGQDLTASDETKKNIDTVDIDIKDPDIQTKEFSNIRLNFNDTNNSNLSLIDLSKSPVFIKFVSAEVSKTIKIDSLDKLKNGFEILLENGKDYTYTINSNNLIFSNVGGNFKTNGLNLQLNFDYYYMNNHINASVALNAIGAVDLSKIDLKTNPIKIVLTNEKHTYQFLFDDNSKINMVLSEVVEMGTYTYTILSNQLIFAKYSDVLTITTTDKDMLFNYAIPLDISSYNLEINMVPIGYGGSFHFLINEGSFIYLTSLLGSSKLDLKVMVYDELDKAVFGIKVENTDRREISIVYKDLNNNTNYRMQITFTGLGEIQKSIVSNLFNFSLGEQTSFNIITSLVVV